MRWRTANRRRGRIAGGSHRQRWKQARLMATSLAKGVLEDAPWVFMWIDAMAAHPWEFRRSIGWQLRSHAPSLLTFIETLMDDVEEEVLKAETAAHYRLRFVEPAGHA